MTKRIKVLFIIWSLERGGAERFLCGLLQNIDLDKFDSVLCCLDWKGDWAPLVEERGIPVMALNKKRGIDFDVISRLKNIIKEGNFDIVNTHLWSADFHGRIAAIQAGTPVIISTAQNVDIWKKWYHRLTDRLLGTKTTCVIAVSQAVKAYYHKDVGLPEQKIEVIPNAVDVGKYENVGDVSYLKNEFNLKEEDFVLACVGRLNNQKGHRYLFESLKELKGEHPFLKVLVVGEGENKEMLINLAKEKGIEACLRFTGQRQDIPQILKFSKALILPSVFEGLPLCVLEAMAAERPVIATNVGGTAELAVDKQTAFIVPAKDVPALTEAIKKLIALPDHGQAMGTRGKEVVQQKFSIQAITRQTEELFNRVIPA